MVWDQHTWMTTFCCRSLPAHSSHHLRPCFSCPHHLKLDEGFLGCSIKTLELSHCVSSTSGWRLLFSFLWCIPSNGYWPPPWFWCCKLVYFIMLNIFYFVVFMFTLWIFMERLSENVLKKCQSEGKEVIYTDLSILRLMYMWTQLQFIALILSCQNR